LRRATRDLRVRQTNQRESANADGVVVSAAYADAHVGWFAAQRYVDVCMSNERPVDFPARQSSRNWSVLLAPGAWLCALGILFTLSGDACTSDTRAPLCALVIICVVAALYSAPLAWRGRSSMETALGVSAIFSAVLMLVAIPVLLLGSCHA